MKDDKPRVDRNKLTPENRRLLDERASLIHKARVYSEGVRPIDETHRELIGQAEALAAGVAAFADRKTFKEGRANGVLAREALDYARRLRTALQAIRLPQSNGDE